jgi:hypothetical protein
MATNISGLFSGASKSDNEYKDEYLAGLMTSPAQRGSQSVLQRLISVQGNRGAQLGADLGGLLGGQTQQQVNDQRVQEVMKGVDLTNPESIMKGADMFTQMGDSARARALTEQADIVGQRQVAQEDRVAKQAAATKTEATRVQGSQMLATKLGITSEQARLFIDTDPKAAVALMNPEVKTETVTTKDSVLLINSQTGAVIADLGTAPKTGASVSFDLGGGDVKALGNDVDAFKKSVAKSQAAHDSATTAKKSINLAIASNSSTAWDAARAIIVRAQGDERVSNADIDRTGTSREILQSLKNTFSSWTTGVPNEKTQKDLFAYASLLERINETKINSEADRWRKASLGAADLTPDQLDLYFPKVQSTQKTPTAETGGNTVSWNSMPSTVTAE